MKITFHKATRYLRRGSLGRLTLTSAPTTVRKPALCDLCAVKPRCKVITATDQLKSVKINVSECGKMVPPLVFIDDVGTFGNFNTIRMGAAWNDRLTVGGVVSLVKQRTGDVFGYATVTALHVVDLDEAVMLHGKNNHTCAGLPEEVAMTSIRKTLTRIYHPFLKEGSLFTVIYLERNDKAIDGVPS